jgi:hypothetical protein
MKAVFLSRIVLSVLLTLGGVAVTHAASPGPLLAESRALLAEGKAQQAFELLAEREAEFAGNPAFDYWFGLTAVRAGKPGRATFALERVIADQPNHAGARLELAAAYLQLGQREAAGEELERLSRLDAPPEAQARIDALNKELGRQERREGQSRRGGYVGLEVGHDDNVGTWPQGLELFPGASIEAVESAYATLRAGAWRRFAPSADQKITLSLNGQLRRNQDDDAEQFDQEYLASRGEWLRDLDGRHDIAGTLDLAMLRRDGERYYTLLGVGGEWRRRFSDRGRLTIGTQLRQLTFENDLYDHLASRLMLRISEQVAPRWTLALDANTDYEASDNERPGGDAVQFGLRGSSWYQLCPRHRLGADLAYGYADYRKDYLPFQAINNTSAESREDHRITASVAWEWFPASRMQVRAQAQYRDQDSSLDAFTYDQTTLSAGLSYYF